METKFRDRNAHRCDRFMKKDETTYEQMCAKIRPAVKEKQVLELAAGTGLISRHIADSASFIEVTDALPEMITKAEKGVPPKTFLFPCRTFFLPYEAGSFDIIILVNALHILSTPEKALAEIRRVLKDDGVFIAPTFTHWENTLPGKPRAFFMDLVGFPLHSRWSSKEYPCFLAENGWNVEKSAVLKASFSLTYDFSLLEKRSRSLIQRFGFLEVAM